jgi:hypothetical protein
MSEAAYWGLGICDSMLVIGAALRSLLLAHLAVIVESALAITGGATNCVLHCVRTKGQSCGPAA